MFYKSKRKLSVIAYLALFAMLMAIMPLGAWAEEGASTPKLTVEGPEDEITYNAEQFSITFEVYHNKALAYLEIDHNLGKHGELPDGVQTLPEFKLYPNEANPWATEDMEDANERKAEAESWGLEADYVAENGTYTWTVTFGDEALKQIRTLTAQHTGSQFKIYSLVCDVNGVKSGSMHDGSYKTTVVTLEEAALPEQSTYKLTHTGLQESYTAGDLIDVTGKTQEQINTAVASATEGLEPVKVTLATDVLGKTGYEAVRILPVNAGEDIQLWAKDTSNNWYDINVTGWGDSSGFELPADYNVTTDIYVLSDKAGDYELKIKLVNLEDENEVIIAEASGTVKVVEAPEAAVEPITGVSPSTNKPIFGEVAFTFGFKSATGELEELELDIYLGDNTGENRDYADHLGINLPAGSDAVANWVDAVVAGYGELDSKYHSILAAAGYNAEAGDDDNKQALKENIFYTGDEKAGTWTIKLDTAVLDVEAIEFLVAVRDDQGAQWGENNYTAYPDKVKAFEYNVTLPEEPEPATFEATGVYGINDNKVYAGYELQDKDDTQIPLIESKIESISVKDPDGNVTELTVVGETDPYLWFNITKKAGTYTYTVVTKGEDAKTYEATIDWNEPTEATVSFQAPAGAEAVFTAASEDAPAQVDFSQVTADKLLDWTSVKDGYYAIELKIEGVDLSEDNVKYAFRMYEDGTAIAPEIKGDLDCQYVTTDWKTGTATMYYVVGEDYSLYKAVINVESLTPAEEPVEPEPEKATLEATGVYGINDNKVYAGYELQDKDDTQIPLIESKIESISVKDPDGNVTELTVVGETDPYLWFNITKKAGTYTYTVVTKGEDAKTYEATIEWEEPTVATVKFQAPAGAEAAFDSATATVDFSKVTADKLLDWTSVKDGYYAIELKIEEVDLSEDNVKYAFRVYEGGTAIAPEIKGDLDCQYVTTDWETGLATMYYVLANGSLYQAKINVASLTPKPEEPVVIGSIARDPGNTGGDLECSIEGDTVIFTSGEIKWYPEEQALDRAAGNRVGVQINAPADFDTSDVKVTIGENEYDWNEIEDGDGYFWWYPLVTADKKEYTATVVWNEASTQVFKVVIGENVTLEPAPDNTAPELVGVSPEAGEVNLEYDETFKLEVTASDENLYELEVDHSMEATLPEFSVYADADNPYGDSASEFAEAGVTVTYDADEQKWTIDFGEEVTDKIVDNGGITFYLVLVDEAGNKWGSMSPPTEENTFAYTVTQGEAPSTYKFSYEVPEEVIAGKEYTVPVTFATDELGDYGYEGVRFQFKAEGPEGATVTFKAVDSNNDEFTFTNEGYWGPPGGFDLPAAYSATTDWTLVFSKAGDYTITFSLIDADTEEVIAGITKTVEITVAEPEPVASTYKFSYQVPADVVAGRKVVVPVTFETDGEPGDIGYDGVRFKFAAEGPEGATVTFKAVDSNNDEYTFTNGGYWGPAGGFDLPAQYSATTDWTLVFGEAGEYTITFSLIDAVSENVIAGITDSVTITVKEKKSTSGGGGGGGGGATSSTPSDSPLLGKDSVSSRTTTDDEGRTVQTITVKTDAVKQVEAARKAGEKAVEIKVDKTDADVTVINVPDEILAAAKDMDLVITTPNASLELPKGLVEALAEAGLDLSIQVEQGNAGEVRSAMSGVSGAEGAEVLGTPTRISTDIKGRTSVTISLTGIRFPADPQEREDFLDSLAVFVIHSDGEKKVIEGEIVFDAKGNPTGIKFEVDRFSTFAVIKTAIAKNVINLTVGEKQIMVNGRVMILDVAPFIVPETGRTLVPVRFVSEALGADVDWQPEAQQVVIRDGDSEIVLAIGSSEVLVGGNSRILDCAPVIANNRTFVPLRFVSETLGADVDYNDATKEITIKR